MSPFLSIDINDVKKAGIKLGLVLLGASATFLEKDLLQIIVISNPYVLLVATGINMAIIDLIRKFITDQEGKLQIGQAVRQLGGIFKK